MIGVMGILMGISGGAGKRTADSMFYSELIARANLGIVETLSNCPEALDSEPRKQKQERKHSKHLRGWHQLWCHRGLSCHFLSGFVARKKRLRKVHLDPIYWPLKVLSDRCST